MCYERQRECVEAMGMEGHVNLDSVTTEASLRR